MAGIRTVTTSRFLEEYESFTNRYREFTFVWISEKQLRHAVGRWMRLNILRHILDDFCQKLEGSLFVLEDFQGLGAFFPKNEVFEKTGGLEQLKRVFQRQQDCVLGDVASVFSIPTNTSGATSVIEWLAKTQSDGVRSGQIDSGSGFPAANTGEDALDVRSLYSLENAIRSADLSQFIRSQPIVPFSNKGPEVELCREFFVAFQRLQSAVLPGVNLQTNSDLFRYVTGVVDRGMLLALETRKTALEDYRRISVNLSIENLSRQDNYIKQLASLKSEPKAIIVEFAVDEVFSNIDEYLILRDYLSTKGIGVAIDRIKPALIPFMRPEYLRADFYKVLWSDAISNAETSTALFERFVAEAGAAKVVLTHCDSANALKYGAARGLSIYQGFFVDQFLARQQNDQRKSRENA